MGRSVLRRIRTDANCEPNMSETQAVRELLPVTAAPDEAPQWVGSGGMR
jgi:hypothetical protein